MAKFQKGMKWEPAVPSSRARDNLVSSPLFRNIKQFTPSYLKDDTCNMYYLIGWEYGRIWFAENHKWEKLMYGKESKGSSDVFKRGYVLKSRKKPSGMLSKLQREKSTSKRRI